MRSHIGFALASIFVGSTAFAQGIIDPYAVSPSAPSSRHAEPLAARSQGDTNAAAVRRIFPINDHLTAFCDGRTTERTYADWNWFDDGAMLLGVCTYAIHQGNEALVFDTFSSLDQANWVRTHLETELGVTEFRVVISHWHLDHVAGNAVYADSPIMIAASGLQKLVEEQAAIESGTQAVFGFPAIDPFVLPNQTYEGQTVLYVGDIRVELTNLNIHSFDSTLVLLPQDRIILAGDTVEDTVTFMVEIAELPEHVANLNTLRDMPWDRLLPNHGNPNIIASGGYDKGIVDATAGYVSDMVRRARTDAGFLHMPLESFVAPYVAKGWTSIWEPYRDVHAYNQGLVYGYWGQ